MKFDLAEVRTRFRSLLVVLVIPMSHCIGTSENCLTCLFRTSYRVKKAGEVEESGLARVIGQAVQWYSLICKPRNLKKGISQLVPAILQHMPLVSLFLAITRLEIKNLVLSRVSSLLS